MGCVVQERCFILKLYGMHIRRSRYQAITHRQFATSLVLVTGRRVGERESK